VVGVAGREEGHGTFAEVSPRDLLKAKDAVVKAKAESRSSTFSTMWPIFDTDTGIAFSLGPRRLDVLAGATRDVAAATRNAAQTWAGLKRERRGR
jgi:hypothetical protein